MKTLLKSTSRSFYLSLRVLPFKLQPSMGIAYLFCRAADSIADTLSVPPSKRLIVLEKFEKSFSEFPISPAHIESLWEDVNDINADASTPEGRLLSRLKDIFGFFKSLSRTEQSLIQSVVQSVIHGMKMDMRLFGESIETVKALSTEQDLEEYLKHIGGAPGLFWAKLCLHHEPKLGGPDKETWIQNAVRFGTGLQMINILRDIPADLKLGRCYLPVDLLTRHHITVEELVAGKTSDRFLSIYHQLIDDTLLRLAQGVSYIEKIPPHHIRLRLAAWWPLSIGLKTLGRLRSQSKVLESAQPVKIKRFEIYWMILSSLVLIPVDQLIRWDFEDLKGRASSGSF